MSRDKIDHERRVYDFLDLLGDLGGVFEIILFVIGLMVYPVSEYSFYLKALSELFLVKTMDKDLMKTPKNLRKKKYKGKIDVVENPFHYPIKLSAKQ